MSLRTPRPGERGFQDWKDLADAFDAIGGVPACGALAENHIEPPQAQAGAVPLDEARRLFDAGWKAAARFCGREDVVADGLIGFGACPQFEAAFAAAQGIKQGGQHGS